MLSLSKYQEAYRLIIVGMLFFFNAIHSQVNLISNPSFERVDTPVYWNSGSFINNSHFPATRNVTNWDWYNSPDYFSKNVPYTGVFRGIPINDFGSSDTEHGVAYGGISVYDIRGDYQEYVNQHLIQPLQTDTIYCLSFFVSRADRIPYAIEKIGAYFSINSPTLVSNYYINAIPQIINQNGFITDTIGWTEIQGCFTAQGGEEYITIGNFNNNPNTDTLRIQSANPLTGVGTDIAYYYIDSVSLYKNNFPTGFNDTGKENSLVVYPNPANDLINFQFPKADEKRKLELYDAIGNLVLSKNASTPSLSLTIDTLSNGIYFYRILVNGIIVNTNKVVIIK